MPFTVLASWDFRGADSPAVKRQSRIGGITLAEAGTGTPTYSSGGVDFTPALSSRLEATVPAGMKADRIWHIVGFRLQDNTVVSEVANIAMIRAAPSSPSHYEAVISAVYGPSFATGSRFAEGSGAFGVNANGTISAGNDYVYAGLHHRGNPAASVRLSGNAWATAGINSQAPNWVAFPDAMFTFGSFWNTINAARVRVAWYIYGSGQITQAEADGIIASPNSFIYPDLPNLSFTTQPANCWAGEVIRPAIVVQSATNGATDVVTIAKNSGTGTLGGTLTAALNGGTPATATFANVIPDLSTAQGEWTLIASAPNHDPLISNSFKVATGTGVPLPSQLKYTEADVQSNFFQRGQSGVTVTLTLLNTAGDPLAGGTHLNVTCQRIIDGGTPLTQTLAEGNINTYTSLGFVQILPGKYAFGLPTMPLTGNRVSYVFSGSGVRLAEYQIDLTEGDPRGAQLEVNTIADGILNRDMGVGTDTGSATVRTVRQALRALRNRFAISGATATFYKEDDSTVSHTAVVTGTPAVTEANPAGGA